jgi:hypothetical protein
MRLKFLETVCLILIVAAFIGCKPSPPVKHTSYVPTVAERASWPKTVDEAVARVLTELTEIQKAEVRDTKEKDLISFHYSLGLMIRNEFGLWKGNKSLMADCQASDPDDASFVIVKAVWQKLQKP